MNKALSYLHFLLIGYACYVFSDMYMINTEKIEAEVKEAESLVSQVGKRQKKLAELEANKGRLAEIKKQVNEIAEEVEALQKRLPEKLSDPENLEFFTNLSKGIRLRKVKFSPGREQVVTFYIKKQYLFKATGTFLQFLIFLEKLSEQEKIFNVSKVVFKRSSKKRRGRFQLIDAEIELEAFKHNPLYKEDRGIDDLKKAQAADDAKKSKGDKKKGRKKGRGKRRK